MAWYVLRVEHETRVVVRNEDQADRLRKNYTPIGGPFHTQAEAMELCDLISIGYRLAESGFVRHRRKQTPQRWRGRTTMAGKP